MGWSTSLVASVGRGRCPEASCAQNMAAFQSFHASGTAVLVRMRQRGTSPADLIGLKGFAELSSVCARRRDR